MGKMETMNINPIQKNFYQESFIAMYLSDRIHMAGDYINCNDAMDEIKKIFCDNSESDKSTMFEKLVSAANHGCFDVADFLGLFYVLKYVMGYLSLKNSWSILRIFMPDSEGAGERSMKNYLDDGVYWYSRRSENLNEGFERFQKETKNLLNRFGGLKNYFKNFVATIFVDPEDLRLNMLLGETRDDFDYYSSAILSFSNVIRINPECANAYFYRARSHVHLGNYNEAIQDYTKAIELDPKNSSLYLARGKARFKIFDFNGAISDFNKLYELLPGRYTVQEIQKLIDEFGSKLK
jgi:tetratricopeptide (TPR) repeat protein